MLCEGTRGHGRVLGDERKAVGSRIPAGLLSERTMSARRFPPPACVIRLAQLLAQLLQELKQQPKGHDKPE